MYTYVNLWGVLISSDKKWYIYKKKNILKKFTSRYFLAKSERGLFSSLCSTVSGYVILILRYQMVAQGDAMTGFVMCFFGLLDVSIDILVIYLFTYITLTQR